MTRLGQPHSSRHQPTIAPKVLGKSFFSTSFHCMRQSFANVFIRLNLSIFVEEPELLQVPHDLAACAHAYNVSGVPKLTMIAAQLSARVDE